MNIPIAYEDEWLLIADKPAGLLTIPTPAKEARTLTSILNDDARSKGAATRLFPCHRLDRETSGLIIYAKGRLAEEKMTELFRLRQIAKAYRGFAHGNVQPVQGLLRSPIEGKPAQTSYRVIAEYPGFSVLDIIPATGRTNQIRIHFKIIGHPLVGEAKFAFRKDFALKAKRVCLHAARIEFTHPFTGKRVQVESPLPADMESFLKKHHAA